MSKRDYLPFPSPDEPDVVLVPLTLGMYAKIDAADYEVAASRRWSAQRSGNGGDSRKWYARGWKDGKQIYLHRLLLETPSGMHTDHINGDTLDCRRSNIRNATRAQNNRNRTSARGSTSPYMGISFKQAKGKWQAAIQNNGATVHLGTFTDEITAAKAYDAAARELHGDFARLNFP